MSQQGKLRARQTILVNRSFQLKVVARLASILLFQAVLFSGLAVLLPAVCGILGSQWEWGWGETQNRVGMVAFLGLPFLCALVGFFGFATLEMFRIAGPCYRFRTILRSLRNGQVPAGVKLRRGDYLQDVAREFDETVASMRGEIEELRALAHRSAEDPEALSQLTAKLDAIELLGSSSEEGADEEEDSAHPWDEAESVTPAGFP